MFDSSASWLNTTPFGRASEPEVNSTTAGAAGSAALKIARGHLSAQKTSHNLSGFQTAWRRSSMNTMR
jgi:hypothetical protein